MIVLTCGHSAKTFDEEHCVMTKEYSREWTHAVAYKSVCAECVKRYEEHGELLHNDEEAAIWLRTEK